MREADRGSAGAAVAAARPLQSRNPAATRAASDPERLVMSAIFPPRTQAAARAVPAAGAAARHSTPARHASAQPAGKQSGLRRPLRRTNAKRWHKAWCRSRPISPSRTACACRPGKNEPAGASARRRLGPASDRRRSPSSAQALRTGVQQAGALMQAVNFPDLRAAGLIDGVFHSIVTSSIEQMEAVRQTGRRRLEESQPVPRRQHHAESGPRPPG